MNDGHAPPARTRTRKTPPNLNWEKRPPAGDAQFDNLRIKVTGRVGWVASSSFADYVRWLGHDRDELSPKGSQHRATLPTGYSVSGSFILRERRGLDAASVEFDISLNPTRTRRYVTDWLEGAAQHVEQ